METEITPDELVVGREYKIHCSNKPLRTGRFFRKLVTGAGPQVQFYHVSNMSNKKTRLTTQGVSCKYYNSDTSLLTKLVSQKKGLPKNIENQLLKFGGKSRRQRRKVQGTKKCLRKN
jgi:hypothetical protein